MFGNRLIEEVNLSEQRRNKDRLAKMRTSKYGSSIDKSKSARKRQKDHSREGRAGNDRFLFGEDTPQTTDDTVHEYLDRSPKPFPISKPIKYYSRGNASHKKRSERPPPPPEVDPQMVKEFYQKTMGCKFQANFAPRRQPDYLDPKTEVIHNTLHVYGTDMMDTSSILRYFAFFNPKSIVVIDASSVNVEFDNFKTAHRALYKNMRHAPPIKQTDEVDEFDPFEPAVPLSDMVWYEMIPHVIFKIERKLFARFATNKDVKTKEASDDRMFMKFIKIKEYLKMGGIIQNSPKRHAMYPRRQRQRSVSRDTYNSSIIDEDPDYVDLLEKMRRRKKIKR